MRSPLTPDPRRDDEPSSLAAIRRQIDAVDEAILDFFEQRQRLAAGAQACKAEQEGLALRPDREAFMLDRLLNRAHAEHRLTVIALWRELLSAGLAAQGELEVISWGLHGLEAEFAARLRFGAGAHYRRASSPEAALKAAERANAVAVLWLHRAHPWWAELPRRESLWIFDTLAGFRGREKPAALAVGRIPAEALAPGVCFRVSLGGDPGSGPRGEREIASGPGLRLCATPDGEAPPKLDRALGWVGRGPALA